jgi:hypothetical protein
VAAAGVLDVYAPRALASATAQAWGLDPGADSGPGVGGCGCSACSACRSHAANKLFASAADADAGRAHPFCKCLVVALPALAQGTYDALFADGGARPSVDRRSQWVQAVLSQEAAASGTLAAPAVDPPVTAEPAAAADDDAMVDAHLQRAPLRHTGARRVLYLEIDATQPVTATVAITRNGKTIAQRAVERLRGRRQLKLVIPLQAEGGPAHVRVQFRNKAGHSKIVTRRIHIPHVQQSAERGAHATSRAA